MNIDPVPLAAWATLISLGITLISVIIRYERRLTHRLDRQDSDVEQLKITLDRQFGNNGFRLADSVKRLETTLDQQTYRLNAHIDQHTTIGA
jgi:hypothetical protein